LSRILTRPRALAATTLTAALLLTAIPGDVVVGASPPSSIAGPVPAETTSTLNQTPATPTKTATTLAVPALGAQGRRAASGHVSPRDPSVQTTSSAQTTVSAASVVVAFARSHLRARYRASATGPTSFDCSGLMWRVFREAGLSTKVASTSARSIYLSYRARGLASRRDPRVGDLIVWGNGSHVGVYIGGGNAISALVRGVGVHRVRAVLTPFTAYLHTHLERLLKPAWELQVATHIRTLRHATRRVFMRTDALTTSPIAGLLRSGTRFVVLARRYDGAHRLWLRAMTLTGRVGWVPAQFSAR
jgi:cell wall-associated NlpC family hydrolase